MGSSVNMPVAYPGSRKILGGAMLVLFSAILCALALIFVQSYLAWICMIPFCYVLQYCTGRNAFYAGALFGIALGGITLYWMPFCIWTYSGGNISVSLVSSLVIAVVLMFFFGLISLTYSALRRREEHLWGNALLIAGIWVLGDILLSFLFPGMPWFSLGMGNALLGNLYAIQPAEFGGIHLLSFSVIFINNLFACFIGRRQWKKLIVPSALVLFYMIAGYALFLNSKQRVTASGKPVTIALLSGNIPEEQKWDEQNGNVLAHHLLALAQKAIKSHPDIVLWPETTVPWTYQPDDDLVQAILKETDAGICHIIGIGTGNDNKLYNSAYCLQPDGRIAGRHDKHFLVRFAEQPVTFFSFPFLKNEAGKLYAEGEDKGVIQTPYGKAGVLICSELFEPAAAKKAVTNGAGILVSMSNNSLFAFAIGAVNQQFFRNRLRAVEVRRDIAVSNNMGVSGMINASGEVVLACRKAGGYTQNVVLHPNNISCVAYDTGLLMMFFSALVVSFFLYLSIKSKT